MADCRKCSDFDWCLENEDCGLFKPKQMTNADRIRSMTDEELADWLYEWAGGSPNFDREGEDNKTCRECWLEWLKQEVET